MKLCLRSSQPFLLQLRTEQNAERQAEIRILQISAKHLRDMGKAIEKRRASVPEDTAAHLRITNRPTD